MEAPAWVSQSSAATTRSLEDVSFADANTGTAVGDDGTILRTTNGGNTWVNQTSGTTTTLIRSSPLRTRITGRLWVTLAQS